MSDRPCNYCDLQMYKKDAKHLGMRLTLVPAQWGMGGMDVYIHPKEVDLRKLTEKQRKPYFKAWMMEIGDHCAC